MKIGVLSDTHGSLPEKVICQLKDCDFLIHAGDIGSEMCYRTLKDLNIPIYMVKGNCDWGSYARFLPETLSFRIDGISFYLIHDQNKLPLMPENTDLVIFGHTHHYACYERLGKTYLNPGSVSDGRGEPASFAVIKVKSGDFTVEKCMV